MRPDFRDPFTDTQVSVVLSTSGQSAGAGAGQREEQGAAKERTNLAVRQGVTGWALLLRWGGRGAESTGADPEFGASQETQTQWHQGGAQRSGMGSWSVSQERNAAVP